MVRGWGNETQPLVSSCGSWVVDENNEAGTSLCLDSFLDKSIFFLIVFHFNNKSFDEVKFWDDENAYVVKFLLLMNENLDEL